jgi:NAD(P)-dependent dehydrogenase (short-subunit alcohol dehydrogenase family)
MTLKGKTVVLAAGNSELLATLACGLGAAGARVCFGQPPKRGTLQGDGREADERVSAVYSEVGKIDVLVNVVGPVPPTAFFDMSRNAWVGLLSAMLDDAFLWSQAVARAMSLAGEQGTIINIVCERGHPGEDIAPFTRLARRGASLP